MNSGEDTEYEKHQRRLKWIEGDYSQRVNTTCPVVPIGR